MCNLSCSFCKVHEREHAFMLLDRFAYIIAQIKELTSLVYLHVKGEPLLHKQLTEILEICYVHNIQVTLVTNGTLLPAKENILLNSTALRQINISLHCINEIPNEKMKMEYLDRVLNFTRLVRDNTQKYISFRIWRFNDNQYFTEFSERLLNRICKEFELETTELQNLKPSKGLQLANKVFLNVDNEFAWPSLNDPYFSDKGFCHALRDHIAILTDGTVIPCCLDGDAVLNLGNIFENDINSILNSERSTLIYKGFSDNLRREELCKKCRFQEKFIF